MEKNVTFGVDVDEVLRALLPGMVRLYNELLAKYGIDPIDIEEVKDFVVENSFPEVERLTGKSPSDWFFRENGHELFRHSLPIEGAVDAIKRLRKYGKVIIISYQKTLMNKVDTLQWLDEHDIEYDGICFLKDKTSVHTDYLIDDNEWNFLGSNARHGVLVNAPYNEGKKLSDVLERSHCLTMVRMNGLREFVDWYEKIADSMEI